MGGSVSYDLDAIDWRSQHLIVTLHDPTSKREKKRIHHQLKKIKGEGEKIVYLPHVSANEDKFFGHFISVDEKILKFLFELHARVVLRKLLFRLLLLLFPLLIPTLDIAKADGLQEYRAGEQVWCTDSPLTGDLEQGAEVHREQRLPQF